MGKKKKNRGNNRGPQKAATAASSSVAAINQQKVVVNTPSPRGTSIKGKAASAMRTTKAGAVDLVTGKTTVEYFFDPSLILQTANSGMDSSFRPVKQGGGAEDPRFFASKHLFMPCTIIKPLDEENSEGTRAGTSGQPYPGPTLVKTSDGVLHKISDSSKLIPLNAPEDYVGIDDVLHLPQVTEASLLHTLKTRYKREDIYTCAGPILISVNPYKNLVVDGESLYSEDRMLYYRSQFAGSSEFDAKPPHLFQCANRAYTALMESAHSTGQASHVDDEDPVMMLEHHTPQGTIRNQSIIISGESGAGKTEATKIIMKFLARITRKSRGGSVVGAPKSPSTPVAQPPPFACPDGKMTAALEDRVLSSNPLLETFGNAQTLRNDNSSRFGKFIHIYFDTTKGGIIGASISNYLLERTRITRQVEGERNYHIFYQLFSGADQETLHDLGLEGGMPGFNYLGNRNSGLTDRDAKDYQGTIRCLESIGLSEREREAVFGIAAAVLHLGNIQFEELTDDEAGVSFKGDPASISHSSLPSLKKACELLGLDEAKLTQAILTKTLIVNGKSIKKSQSVALAEDKRDALAKMTYSCLFLWLVNCVNEKLDQTANDTNAQRQTSDRGDIGFIGVLDIYGFECFEVNGYEQLLINYCNEKLQRHFNRHLFEVEQQIYLNEGVDWKYITFNDNKPCLELIEGGSGTVGVLNTLDDAWGAMGSAQEKDGKFVAHLHKLFGPVSGTEFKKDNADAVSGHKNFITPKIGLDCQFGIIHYAGEVRYTADGFVEKNMDTLSNEIKELGEESTVDLSKRVYACGSFSASSPRSSQRSSIRGVSVGSQFRTSLQSLVADLERTQPHYIRCIKPNLSKAPSAFMSGEVLKQLRYSGMMEAIRIRREGYGLREEHESFYHRFSVLLNADEMEGGEAGIAQLVKALSTRLGVSDADWQIGHTKVFLRRELAEKLEHLAKLRVHMAARTIGRFSRYVIYRRLSLLLVAWMRFRLIMIKKNRRARAATKLASVVRRRRQVQAYKTVIRGIIRIQAEQRRKQSSQLTRKLHDPFYNMSFRDCQQLLQAEKSKLHDSIASKDFQLAAELEANISSLEEAVEKKRPLTRSVLEQKIESAQKELDDAVQRKAFSECGALQGRLEELTSKRQELPTVDELHQSVQRIEAEIALEVKKRDFAAAAAHQVNLEKARACLADVMAAEGVEDTGAHSENQKSSYGFESRAQLEQEISDISLQINKAIQSKNFTKASSLQHILDEREKMRPLFPSVKELQAELESAKKKLEEAVSKKDFAAAGKLNEEIDRIEKKIEEERDNMPGTNATDEAPEVAFETNDGEKKVFESRATLEKAISEMSAKVSQSVGLKDFKRADLLQSDVDKMTSLRKFLPTVAELQGELQERKKELNAAVASKQFAKADECHVAIEELEAKITKEKSVVKTSADNGIEVASVRTSPALPFSTPVVTTSSKSVSSAPIRAAVGPPLEVGSDVSRTVRKLRPSKPLTATSCETIGTVATMLARKRANACIIVDPTSGQLEGIVTDTDFTRRCIAKNVDAAVTKISTIMTANPVCVSLADPALDALTTMVLNHFRHLPVIDSHGCVAGLLDISKCLTEAITKLETHDEQSTVISEEMVKQISVAGGSQAALQEFLGGLMSQALGGSAVPTLRSLLHSKPSTIVSPLTTIRDAGMRMAENRRAALVVEEGKLVGIFAFKDMMSRAIAKELDVDSTPVSEVMTPEPDSVTPDITVLEALQIMADNKYLTLPVCEEDNGKVVGLVDVLDVIYACGGAEGWRSVFKSAMDIDDDDVSDVTSVHSATSARDKAKQASGQLDQNPLSAVKESTEEQPVSKLRPSKPIVVAGEDSILRTVKLLAKKRGTASLVMDPIGGLSGILSDKDVVCRVVAKNIDPGASVLEVMTPNPTCVLLTDSATDALNLMVENRFRHLPVLDDHGLVVGCLDITKCLNIIIKKLVRSQDKSAIAAEDVVNKVVGANGAQAAALQALLSTALGNKTVPTLRSLLHSKPSTLVGPSTTIRDVGVRMADNRHAALVVDENDGHLLGIFGFKDMMSRAVAKELDLDLTPVSEVMTPEPDTASPDITVLEALQVMADNKYLTLPVCEDNGKVCGLVDVMDVIYGCGGAEGWRSILSSAMDRIDDQTSEVSGRSGSVRSTATPGSLRKTKNKEKTVANLRPSKPHLSQSSENILSVAQLLQRKRGDASLVVDAEGGIAGIITDTDFTRRVVAKDIIPSTTAVSTVMTPNPTCVATTDSAMDALILMVEHHFRHLPVVDGEGLVVGLLDIGKCLTDAIGRLERAKKKKSGSSAMDVVNQAAALQIPGNPNAAAALEAILGSLMSQAAGGQAVPTLRQLLRGKPRTIVGPSTTIRETANLMAESRHAALVVDESGCLVGIFGFKDMMTRVIACELSPDATEVAEVMTSDPEFVSPDITVLEALQTMYDNKFLTLPVCEEDGGVVGLVNVIELIYGCGGSEGWRSIFSSAMDLDYPERDVDAAPRQSLPKKSAPKSPETTPLATYLESHESNIPTTLEFEGMDNDDFQSFTGSTLPETITRSAGGNHAVFKVSDPSGNTHRIKCEISISDLLDVVAEKASIPLRSLQLQYVDDEGDVVTMTSDDDVAEAWVLARKAGNKHAKISAIVGEAKPLADPAMMAVGGAAAVAVGIAAFMLFRPKAGS